jgi:hypothetical protein
MFSIMLLDESLGHLVSMSARWYNLARSATLAQWQSNRFVSDRLSVQVRWVAQKFQKPQAGIPMPGIGPVRGAFL